MTKNRSLPSSAIERDITRRYYMVKPVTSVLGKKFHYQNYSPHELQSRPYLEDNPLTPVDNLHKLVTIVTKHPIGHNGLFKPTVAEVLLQIPISFFDTVVAFEIIEMDDAKRLIESGMYLAHTHLYKKD